MAQAAAHRTQVATHAAQAAPNRTQVAIDRLPRQATRSVEQVLVNARRLGLEPLVQACQEELRARGSLILTAAEAELSATVSARVAGKGLAEVIKIAFTEVPAKPEEILILRRISQHPGISHSELLKVYGRGDLSLVIGHMVYYRFGYFRPTLTSSVQSDILLERDSTSGKVCYTLRPDAAEAFAALGILN
jgi:hypothetical protein